MYKSVPRDLMNSRKAFSAFCWLWKCFPCKKVVKMLEEVVVSRWEVRWIWWMRQNFVAQFVQLLKRWLCKVGQAPSWGGTGPPLLTNACCRRCSFQCVSSLLSTLLRCNSFPGIQKAVGDQMGSRPPNRGHDLFWCKSGFGKHFGASSLSNHWAGCHLSS